VVRERPTRATRLLSVMRLRRRAQVRAADETPAGPCLLHAGGVSLDPRGATARSRCCATRTRSESDRRFRAHVGTTLAAASTARQVVRRVRARRGRFVRSLALSPPRAYGHGFTVLSPAPQARADCASQCNPQFVARGPGLTRCQRAIAVDCIAHAL